MRRLLKQLYINLKGDTTYRVLKSSNAYKVDTKHSSYGE